jgi:hypothetical protein
MKLYILTPGFIIGSLFCFLNAMEHRLENPAKLPLTVETMIYHSIEEVRTSLPPYADNESQQYSVDDEFDRLSVFLKADKEKVRQKIRSCDNDTYLNLNNFLSPNPMSINYIVKVPINATEMAILSRRILLERLSFLLNRALTTFDLIGLKYYWEFIYLYNQMSTEINTLNASPSESAYKQLTQAACSLSEEQSMSIHSLFVKHLHEHNFSHSSTKNPGDYVRALMHQYTSHTLESLYTFFGISWFLFLLQKDGTIPIKDLFNDIAAPPLLKISVSIIMQWWQEKKKEEGVQSVTSTTTHFDVIINHLKLACMHAHAHDARSLFYALPKELMGYIFHYILPVSIHELLAWLRYEGIYSQ